MGHTRGRSPGSQESRDSWLLAAPGPIFLPLCFLPLRVPPAAVHRPQMAPSLPSAWPIIAFLVAIVVEQTCAWGGTQIITCIPEATVMPAKSSYTSTFPVVKCAGLSGKTFHSIHSFAHSTHMYQGHTVCHAVLGTRAPGGTGSLARETDRQSHASRTSSKHVVGTARRVKGSHLSEGPRH